ncbi:hypothetical protein [Hyphomicrobium sp.]|uniref:hypothetical protein n=1 Tax=Hyphomicrobium sp. TaxID=82 RepID=UPI002E37F549|nr:hypothetical protein [Hyphomicrobium sp.]HEX2842894.1 hypothetical protein [Hyphomicrobium sp.]
MDANTWVVVANVGASAPAARSDSSGDMEQLEMMEFVLMSEHVSREAAEEDAMTRRAQQDGWTYLVLPKREYGASMHVPERAV